MTLAITNSAFSPRSACSSVRNHHQQDVGKSAGLRSIKKSELINALQLVHEGHENPWKLRTDQATYQLFKNANRPTRPSETNRALRFPTEASSYCALSELLRGALATQYLTESAQWEAGKHAIFRGVLQEWWMRIDKLRGVKFYRFSIAISPKKVHYVGVPVPAATAYANTGYEDFNAPFRVLPAWGSARVSPDPNRHI